FAYAVALAVTLPISGGYLNPAVTLMLWVFKRVDGLRATGFIAVQLLAAVLAGLILRFLFPEDTVLVPSRIGTPHVNLAALDTGSGAFWRRLKGVVVERTLRFCLGFSIFGTVLAPRAPRWAGGWVNRLAGLWVGLVMVAVTLVGFNLTGAAV